MINDYFERPWLLEQMRSSSVGPYLDGFSDSLAGLGFCVEAIRKYTRMAVHIGHWAHRRGLSLGSWDDDIIEGFLRHLLRCKAGENG